ncbi:MAG: hypothetical protein JWP14_2774 [Frankiales bacterium]|nr:hypothetical protein [Frankiales bacterium]
MLGGIALLGVVTATVAAWFVHRFSALQVQEQLVQEEQSTLLAQLEELNVRLARMEAVLERRAI